VDPGDKNSHFSRQTLEGFPNLKNISFFEAKISDDLFLVIDSKMSFYAPNEKLPVKSLF